MLKIRLINTLFALVVITLLFSGVLAIYSTSYNESSTHYLLRQLQWVVIGLVAAVTLAMTPMDILSKYSKAVIIAVMFALLYLVIAIKLNTISLKLRNAPLHIPFTIFSHGTCRWVGTSFFSIQPSEFGKFAVILFLSTYYGLRDKIKTETFWEGFAIPGLFTSVMLGLIVLGQSFSNTVITGAIAIIIMFLAGVKLRFLCSAGVIALLLGIVAVFATPYRRKRIINYLYMSKQEVQMTTGEFKANNDQLKRSICAIGSGGKFGLGPGKGRLKNKSIPESKTDFIFAVIGEEYGFLGMCLGLSLYIAFMVLSFMIAKQSKDKRGALICMAVGFFIPFQAFYNLGVICGLLPTTGVTAPLVSYGGSSILSVMLCIGLVLNTCQKNYREYLKASCNQ